MADPGSSASKPHSAKCKVSKVPAGNTSQRPHQVSSQSEVFPNLRRQNHINIFNNAISGKTKPLSEKDGIDLGEGGTNPRIVGKRLVSRAVSLRNSAAALAKSRVIDSESPLQQAKSCTPSSTCMKVVTRKEPLQSSNGLKEGHRKNSRSILRAPLKEHIQKEQAKSARWGAYGTRSVLGNSPLGKSSSADKEKSPNKGISTVGFPSVLDKGKSPIGVLSTANNRGQQSVRAGSAVSHGVMLQQATVPVKCTEIPSAAASWSGSCRVYNASQQLEGIHTFQAHPPSRVHKMVYEFSKLMPDLLQFELTPCYDIWVNIDQHLCRDKRDIGLYFFPANKERWDKYDRLLEVMQEKDYAMRASVKDRELLIFPSRVLSSNCKQWGGRHYLWGLFRKVDKPLMKLKKNQFLIDVEMEEEVAMTEDMDIDMDGGEEIPGRQDSMPPSPHSLLVPPLPPVLHERPLHVLSPAPPRHEPPPLKKVKIEGEEDYPLPPAPLYVPPPPPHHVPQSPPLSPPSRGPLRRVKIEGFPDCHPGFEPRL